MQIRTHIHDHVVWCTGLWLTESSPHPVCRSDEGRVHSDKALFVHRTMSTTTVTIVTSRTTSSGNATASVDRLTTSAWSGMSANISIMSWFSTSLTRGGRPVNRLRLNHPTAWSTATIIETTSPASTSAMTTSASSATSRYVHRVIDRHWRCEPVKL